MTRYEEVCEDLLISPKTWLVTGVAGFIGSNLLEKLLLLNQKVVGLDNFATGHQHNLDEVKFNSSSIGVSTRKALETAVAKIVKRMIRKQIFDH